MLKNCENVTWKNFFFSGNGKKWEKKERKDIKKIQRMNLFIMMVEEQNMSKEIYK